MTMNVESVEGDNLCNSAISSMFGHGSEDMEDDPGIM